MMGFTHATSGAAAWIAVTGALPIVTSGAYPLDPVGVLAGAAVCAGAALLPDADHHSATIAQSVPVLGRVVTGVVGELSGGHRHGAHSPVAVLLVAVGAWGLTLLTVPSEPAGTIAIGAGIGTAALTAFGLKARGFARNWFAAWVLGALLGAFIVVFAPEQVAWFPLAVTIGFVAHLAGDLLTTGGLPGLLWPWVPRPPEVLRPMPVLNRLWLPNGYVALPLLGDTGSFRETMLGAALALYCFAGFAYEGLLLVGVDVFAGW
ncbi:metal-dependent hydrolase [Agromyces sp. SYSU K20354]|uniref:metal-dependent hydrolase n=1 Tax=Agromyces cavernae TaxID=2898659 RepID=UPI001E413DE1|nr:metal-dependent hydrolase [Agromyces cavernae]MCD2442569.1 metal-dependent hydrolase [Agromyces cavernae]